MSIKSTLWELFDELPEDDYGLWPLTDLLNIKTGRRTMPHQVKKYAKEYADRAGAEFYCVVQNEAIYHYKPGFRIAGSLPGRE